MDELSRIKYEISSKTKIEVENIKLGMTPQEVISIAGKPRSVRKQYVNIEWGIYYNYGKVWVIFEGGLVSCLVKTEYFSFGLTCRRHKLVSTNIGVVK